MTPWLSVLVAAAVGVGQVPALVGHRGLIHQAPENTLAAFGACLDLKLGFEVDVHRTKDGQLVCIHDDDVRRTTNGAGKVAELTFDAVRRLDAGAAFDPAFAGQRVPALGELFALIQARRVPELPIAVDVKINDATVAEDIVRLAEKHEITKQLMCIGLTISDLKLRERIRKAHAKIGVAVLAQKSTDLSAALADKHSDWIYVRFVPTPEEVKQIHRQGKRAFIVGPLVAGLEPDNWARAKASGVDALLTDYPLECRASWKKAR